MTKKKLVFSAFAALLLVLFCATKLTLASTQVYTVVYPDTQGESDVYYHICKTTYYGKEPQITGLDKKAISAVFTPQTDGSVRTLGNKQGWLYQEEGRAYLCWTVSPEYSLVLEYDPLVYQEQEMLEMAASVPMNHETVEA